MTEEEIQDLYKRVKAAEGPQSEEETAGGNSEVPTAAFDEKTLDEKVPPPNSSVKTIARDALEQVCFLSWHLRASLCAYIDSHGGDHFAG